MFLTRAKSFDEPMSPAVTARIGGFRPGHYTRLGAAIRHASAMLAEEAAARRLLLVLTDGKPNDLDHYEGVHGIEDSRMAVREARALGQSVHGVVVDADGQDWFARIFGRGGFTLLPHPARLAARAARDLSDPDHGDLTHAPPPAAPRARPRAGARRALRAPGAAGRDRRRRASPTRSPPLALVLALGAAQWLVSRR